VFSFQRPGGILDTISPGVGGILVRELFNGVRVLCWCFLTCGTVYKHFGNDTISVVSFLAGPPSFYTANLDVARQVAGGALRTSFIKPENASTPLLYDLSNHCLATSYLSALIVYGE